MNTKTTRHLTVRPARKVTFYRVRVGPQYAVRRSRKSERLTGTAYRLTEQKPPCGTESLADAQAAVAAFPGAFLESYQSEVMDVCF